LARMLLERDGSWSGYRSRKGLRSSDQLVIPLKSPVKLIVDYITNHVDDEDRVHWLHDIYGYDPS
jgi:murein L,D-transpeptidase YcbB/YkuD